MQENPEEVLRFWFGEAVQQPDEAGERMRFWFRPDRATDELVATRFRRTVEHAALGLFRAWELHPRHCLALIIVLDQFPRNMYRGTAAAFQLDHHALGVARRGVAAGHLSALATLEIGFLLMPFQHAEHLATQLEGVALFRQLAESAGPEWRPHAENMLRYARLHLEIIQRFGRFPHRSAILGRASTPAEREYLAANPDAFGQRRP
jgi:uncharacterized protein (DUF924 family)